MADDPVSDARSYARMGKRKAPWLTEADVPDMPPANMDPSAREAVMKERRRIKERLREQQRTLTRPRRSGISSGAPRSRRRTPGVQPCASTRSRGVCLTLGGSDRCQLSMRMPSTAWSRSLSSSAAATKTATLSGVLGKAC
eukprot:4121955-Prymnesium_polylepis.3